MEVRQGRRQEATIPPPPTRPAVPTPAQDPARRSLRSAPGSGWVWSDSLRLGLLLGTGELALARLTSGDPVSPDAIAVSLLAWAGLSGLPALAIDLLPLPPRRRRVLGALLASGLCTLVGMGILGPAVRALAGRTVTLACSVGLFVVAAALISLSPSRRLRFFAVALFLAFTSLAAWLLGPASLPPLVTLLALGLGWSALAILCAAPRGPLLGLLLGIGIARLPTAAPRVDWSARPPGEGPDILLITVDTLRFDAAQQMTSYQRLAREGLALTEVQAPAPWTLPSVASLLTGVSPLTHGAGARPYLTLDDLDVRQQAADLPHDLLQRHPQLTLDEVQREPDLLLAVKALVDRDRPRVPGRFLLTGSANLLLMEAVADSLAGRAAYRVLHPLTRREQLGLGCPGRWSDLLRERSDSWPALLVEDEAPEEDWKALARRGGFPIPALELATDRARATWFEGYLRTYLECDLRDLANIQSLPDFRRLMRAAAHRLGGLLNSAELGRDLGLPATTVQRHLGLLETSHLLVRLEPYSVNRTKRLIKAPKLYWGDAGLALHLGGGEPTGAHLENLVITDLLAWADATPGPRPQILYWRTASGQEVDVVIEMADRLVGIAVKASARPSHRDARHIQAFRQEYGAAVAGCLLLHTGQETYRLSEGVVAAPWWRVL